VLQAALGSGISSPPTVDALLQCAYLYAGNPDECVTHHDGVNGGTRGEQRGGCGRATASATVAALGVALGYHLDLGHAWLHDCDREEDRTCARTASTAQAASRPTPKEWTVRLVWVVVRRWMPDVGVRQLPASSMGGSTRPRVQLDFAPAVPQRELHFGRHESLLREPNDIHVRSELHDDGRGLPRRVRQRAAA
jgi:hypothetical protein